MGRRHPAAWMAGGFAIVLCVAGGVFGQQLWRRPEGTPALRGEAAARSLGCFACHGAEGRGGIGDPRARGGLLPGWDGPTAATFARDEQEIREWILDGRPQRRSATERAALVPMPAYRGRISAGDLDDLVAYFRAVSGWCAEIPESAYEGRKVALRFGCFGCHGPSGAGGCANPGSFKGHIPSWDGDEFAELVQDDAELREWILDGSPRRLRDNPIARHFLDGQAIRMPAYREHLSDEEVGRLVAYVRWLRKK